MSKETILDKNAFLVSETDAKGIIRFTNEDFCKVAGYNLSELLGKPHNIVRHKDMPKAAFKSLWETVQKGNIWTGYVKNICKSEDDNTIATKAIRLMLERIRKKTGKSIKHWFTTELGHEKTERLHLHGIVWGIGTDQLVEEKWNYGITYTGNYVNEKTINYITKYMTKIDEKHPDFVGKVLCSKGIGAGYTKGPDAAKHKYKKGKTIETYRLRNGAKINLPYIVTGKQIGRASCRERVCQYV